MSEASRIGFYFAHPSQFHVFKYVISSLKEQGHSILIYIKSKDILETLLEEQGWDYVNLLSKSHKKRYMLNQITILLKKNLKLIHQIKKNRIDIIVTAASDISVAAYLSQIPIIVLNDDDASVIPLSGIVGWPFSSIILAPGSCNMGKWVKKTIAYNAFQKTTYTHPKYFFPDKSVLKKYGIDGKFFIIRSVSLGAHHDKNIRGLNNEVVNNTISLLSDIGRVIISSERELPDNMQKYILKMEASDMLHLLYFCDLLIADSQSMCHEAALLGTPSIRYNDFVGRIGVLNELENTYELAIGIKPDNDQLLLDKIKEMVTGNRKENRDKAEKLHHESIDLNAFLLWFITNYPESKSMLLEQPEYQKVFIDEK